MMFTKQKCGNESAKILNNQANLGRMVTNKLAGLSLITIGALCFTPLALRAFISKRIVTERIFAANFLDGKFLPLFERHNGVFMNESFRLTGFFKKISTDSKIIKEISEIIKQDNLSYKHLWEATSSVQKISNSLLAGGITIAGFNIISKSSAHLNISDIIRDSEESPTSANLPRNSVTEVTSERLQLSSISKAK